MKITKKSIVQIICLFLIKYLYMYVTVTTLEGLSYTGVIGGYNIDYNSGKEIIASVVMLIIAFYYSCKPVEYSLSSVVLHVLFIFYYIPVNSAYAIHNVETTFFVLATVYFSLILLLLMHCQSKSTIIIGREYEKLLYSNKVAIFCFTICMGIILFKLYYNGLDFNFSIASEFVYSNREAFNTKLSGLAGTFLGYFYALFSKIGTTIAPIYLFISLKKKKLFSIAVSLLAIFSEYALTSMKADLFGGILVAGIYVAYCFGWLNKFHTFFNMLMVGIMSLCFIERKIVRIGTLYFIFIRRVFQTPARLSYLYYDFFSKHQKVLFTDSVFGLQRFLPHVYSSSPLEIISDAYFSGTMSSPNTGLFGAAYMQLGLAGIILQPILILLLVRWAEKLLSGYGKGFIAVIGINTVMTMQNVPILRTDFVLSVVLVFALLGLLPRISDNGKLKLDQ